MKKYSIILIVAALSLLAVSCKKESAGQTRITYYASITLSGDNPYVMAVGGTYTEPGFSAEMKGEDVSSQVTVDASSVDASTPGAYKVNYLIVNADGFPATASRDVLVINPGKVNTVYEGRAHNASLSRDYTGAIIVVEDAGSGKYYVNDLLGGYYFYGIYPGYEPTYDFHWEGYFSVNGDNTLKFEGTENDWYFYDPADEAAFVGTYDPATGVLDWNFGFCFVTLTPFTLN